MQAITTKYLGATNYRPSRVKAQCAAGNITVSYDYGLSANGNHHNAAKALIAKLSAKAVDLYGDDKAWRGVWAFGDIGTGNAYVRTTLASGTPIEEAFTI